MPYQTHTDAERRSMLEAIGVSTIDDLFEMVPKGARLERPLDIPEGICEMDLIAHLEDIGRKNRDCSQAACFLGGGIYDHFIPSVVDHLASRAESYTAYTPYQAEASQGNLQALFEYQTMLVRLTGMDVANASLYDGATAMVEAMLMARATTRRNKVVVAGSVHPEYREVMETYVAGLDVEVVTVPAPCGTVDPDAVAAVVDEDTACVILQHPNFFGCLEPTQRIAQIAHAKEALYLAVFEPISLGLLTRPGDYGADIAVTEGQPLGIPMALGGPVLGIMACQERFVRRMPGRLVGQTTDRRGNRCWVLTMQTREQHIRREKATSNICTNQGLMAMRAAVYLAAMGPRGLRETAALCVQKSRYLARRLVETGAAELAFDAPTFKEFVVRLPSAKAASEAIDRAAERGFYIGPGLGRWYPDLADCLLVAVTEKRTAAQIDALVDAIRG